MALLTTAAYPQSTTVGSTRSGARPSTIAADYGKLPLSFEANQGQTDPQVRFLSRGNGYSLFLTDSAAVLALTRGGPSPRGKPDRLGLVGKNSVAPGKPAKTDVVRMELAGATRGLHVTGDGLLPGTANYFIGNDPAKWRSAVPTYARVKYAGVYPGVDLVYYGNQRQLEYDFVVAPNADAKLVRLHFAGAKTLKLDSKGDLQVIAKDGEIAFHKPVVYQEIDGQREPIKGRFTLLPKNSIGFSVGSYDRSRMLVIDPTLVYSTYLGGSIEDAAYGIAVDLNGSAYVVGETFSGDFPVTPGAFQRSIGGPPNNHSNAFITKLNAAGTALIYSTYLGGNGRDYGNAIAVDAAGNAFVTGHENSANFPVTSGAFQTTRPGGSAAFITKLNPSGSGLLYSTYLGAAGNANARAIAIDSTGDAYLTGNTNSAMFPVTGGAFQTHSPGGSYFTAFVTKLNPAGSALIYSTYLGGTGAGDGEAGLGIALDTNGDAFVTGITNSTDFPVTSGAFQETNNAASAGSSNAFITKVNPTGTALLYSTFLGGSGMAGNDNSDFGSGIAVDDAGNAYVAGSALSTDFPITSGAFQTVNHAPNGGTAFVTKLNVAGSALVFSTYLGGSTADAANAIALDSSGNVYTGGSTSSTGFPVTSDAFQTDIVDSPNAFVTKFNSAGTALLYSSFLGGTYTGASVIGIATDTVGDAYVTGLTGGTDFPVTNGAFKTSNGFGDDTGFVSKFGLAPLDLSQPGIIFGDVPLGTTTPTLLITATNYTSSPAGYLSESNLTEFKITAGTCSPIATGTMLGGGDSCTFLVSFSPTALGPVTGSFTIHTVAGNVTFYMTGAGAPATPAKPPKSNPILPILPRKPL